MSRPVYIAYAPDQGQNRLWGIPVLGTAIRSILVIPQAIVLSLLAVFVSPGILLCWIPVLFRGRQAGWAYILFGGYLRLSTRIALYVVLMTGAYPPFGPGGEHTVTVTYDETERQNRLWGIPVLGMAIRLVLLIPHLVALWFVGVIAALATLFSWLPVLLTGHTAGWVVRWVGGYYRWTIRVSSYALLLTAKYPPFSLS